MEIIAMIDFVLYKIMKAGSHLEIRSKRYSERLCSSSIITYFSAICLIPMNLVPNKQVFNEISI